MVILSAKALFIANYNSMLSQSARAILLQGVTGTVLQSATSLIIKV